MKLIDLHRNGKLVDDVATLEAVSTYMMQSNPFSENTFFIGRNKPAVVIGRFQDAYAEVDLDYLRQHHITLMRRAAGGGAVYTDLGNFVYMYHVVDPNDRKYWLDFKHYATPLVKVLEALGVKDVTITGRNDVAIGGRKVSGMAAFQLDDRFSIGGTLLYDVDIETAGKVLTPVRSKLESKGFASVNSRIFDVKAALPDELKNLDAAEFEEIWLRSLFNVDSVDKIERVFFSDTDWQKIDAIVSDKFGNQKWNIGDRPHYSRYANQRFEQGTISVNFEVANNQVTHFNLYGDFFTKENDISEAENEMIGVDMNEIDLGDRFDNGKLKTVLPWMSGSEFAKLMMNSEKLG
ncbi:lipoate--protein ligase [Lentilactobacillus sp. Marseille-Q4993]|uniref:lipoate--protein ligase n=1 Tax=Lentilactobacillus sp. Marseille-Q4993 TaxID=3039492 RepID=UPI0024BCBB2F|nr:lipoate--protein ligase [Lentilactobacillus sp. Marseille-Q4993]